MCNYDKPQTSACENHCSTRNVSNEVVFMKATAIYNFLWILANFWKALLDLSNSKSLSVPYPSDSLRVVVSNN